MSEEGKNLQPKQSEKPVMEDGMGKSTIENGRRNQWKTIREAEREGDEK